VEHGWAATTVRDVAGEAGVSVPTVYSAYGNKTGLIQAIADAADLSLPAPSAKTSPPRSTSTPPCAPSTCTPPSPANEAGLPTESNPGGPPPSPANSSLDDSASADPELVYYRP
jgi:hypothetical protein